ncbi:MAG: hypothetical protein LQ344_003552 [Seirophora lacunosa]|nr:MAG: hypothetical protein LQ344_003552 [Seirophora lacunosa]
MDQLPPEMLDRIARQLSNDKYALKCLRLSTQSFGAAAIKYLYQDLILYNTTCSWDNFSLVISHPIYSRFVRSIESSSPRCDCLDCIDSSGNLDRRVTLCDTSSGVTALKLTGFCHPFSQVLAQINDFSNIRKLELDFSTPILYCFNMEILPFFEHTLKPIWFPKLKDTLTPDILPFVSHVETATTMASKGLNPIVPRVACLLRSLEDITGQALLPLLAQRKCQGHSPARSLYSNYIRPYIQASQW